MFHPGFRIRKFLIPDPGSGSEILSSQILQEKWDANFFFYCKGYGKNTGILESDEREFFGVYTGTSKKYS
jgi:hypothetical protein